jgi:hypothetical protein
MKSIAVFFIAVFFLCAGKAQDITIPAKFPGGDSAWLVYLDTSFNNQYIRSQLTKKDIERFGSSQRVEYGFGIMTDGTISLIIIQGTVAQPVRNEINRVLKNSPRWTPATFNGKAVVYRKKQVSVFTFE